MTLPIVTTFRSKYLRGGDGGEPMDIVAVLNSQWSTDLHYSQYHANVRLTKSVLGTVPFEVLGIDVDGHDVQVSVGHLDDFISNVKDIRFVPNLVHRTRAGVRLIYYIVPIYQPAQFESHAHAAREAIAEGVACLSPVLRVDLQTRDWTRLFRAARVVRDGRRTWDIPVHHLHNDLLDLMQFEPVVIPVHPSPPARAFFSSRPPAFIHKLIAGVQASSGHGGHQRTFYVARLLASHFSRPDAEQILAAWNQTNAYPLWSARELQHKLDDAYGRAK